jgi:hypothetical protein
MIQAFPGKERSGKTGLRYSIIRGIFYRAKSEGNYKLFEMVRIVPSPESLQKLYDAAL